MPSSGKIAPNAIDSARIQLDINYNLPCTILSSTCTTQHHIWHLAIGQHKCKHVLTMKTVLIPSALLNLTRSQWSSGSMSDCSARDCSARGPGIESRCGQLCLSHNHCDLQPWARAVCTLPAVPRSTQPSTLRGTVNDYPLLG